MKARLRWLPEALDDLKRLHAFIAAHNPDAARRAVESLVAAAASLQDFPEMGRPWDAELQVRELTVRFGARGYAIRYRLFEDQIILLRVWHALEER